MRALAVIDGEHYAPVVRDALAALPYDFVGALLVGGTEKLRGAEDYGVPLVDSLDAVAADAVVDLSDEPVLSPGDRFRLASRSLVLGMAYVGADFRFEPPRYEPFELPSLAVIGTGKRSRQDGRDRSRCAAARARPQRGRRCDGPWRPTRARADRFAAERRRSPHAVARRPSCGSDHLETAALVGVTTIGCRRAGGGLAGAVFESNVSEGADLARSLDPDVVVFDGSGAAIPPVQTTARILVTTRGHDLRRVSQSRIGLRSRIWSWAWATSPEPT